MGAVFQFIPFATAGTRAFFGLTFPGFYVVGIVIFAAIMTFVIIELLKAAVRSKVAWFSD